MKSKEDRLIDAVKHGDLPKVNKLIKGKFLSSGVDIKSISCNLAIREAIYGGFIEIVKYLLDAGVEVNCKDELNSNETPLILACKTNQTEIIKLLLKSGATVNVRTKKTQTYTNFIEGWTPLFWAVEKENIEIVKLLLSQGANVNVKLSDGRTPLMLAADYRNKMIAAELLGNGADIDIKDNKGNTAESYGNEAIKYLILYSRKLKKDPDQSTNSEN